MQRVQDILFAVCLDLLARKGFTSADVDRLQGDGVVAAQAFDGAGEQGFDAVPQADFSADVGGDAVVRIAPHELQGLAGLLLGKHVQVRRLSQIDRQRLFERAVENRVGSGVHEVGDQNGIFFG